MAKSFIYYSLRRQGDFHRIHAGAGIGNSDRRDVRSQSFDYSINMVRRNACLILSTNLCQHWSRPCRSLGGRKMAYPPRLIARLVYLYPGTRAATLVCDQLSAIKPMKRSVDNITLYSCEQLCTEPRQLAGQRSVSGTPKKNGTEKRG